MVGDTVTVPWYPFTKNLSSRESILFIADGLTINPLEIIILAHRAVVDPAHARRSPTGSCKRGVMWKPMMVFTGFVFLGLVYGLSRGGHDTTVAVWEIRPLLYLPILYVLITNLLTTARQYERLFMCALVGCRRAEPARAAVLPLARSATSATTSRPHRARGVDPRRRR